MSDDPILTPETSASKHRSKTSGKATEKRESGLNAVSLKGKENRHQVTQLQLEQFIYAKRKLREAQFEYEQIRREIQRELNLGATIQSGVHTASIVTTERLTVK